MKHLIAVAAIIVVVPSWAVVGAAAGRDVFERTGSRRQACLAAAALVTAGMAHVAVTWDVLT